MKLLIAYYHRAAILGHFGATIIYCELTKEVGGYRRLLNDRLMYELWLASF